MKKNLLRIVCLFVVICPLIACGKSKSKPTTPVVESISVGECINTCTLISEEDFQLRVNLKNEEEYTIVSITINDIEYEKNEFEINDKKSLITIDFDAPNIEGSFEYTIDSMKYAKKNNAIEEIFVDKKILLNFEMLRNPKEDFETISNSDIRNLTNVNRYFSNESIESVYIFNIENSSYVGAYVNAMGSKGNIVYAIVAENDTETIKGIKIIEHNEEPSMGGNLIESEEYLDIFKDFPLYNNFDLIYDDSNLITDESIAAWGIMNSLKSIRHDILAFFGNDTIYDWTNFNGEYDIEKSSENEFVDLNKSQLKNMTNGSYLIFATSPGSADGSHLTIALNDYMKNTNHKIYKIDFYSFREVYTSYKLATAAQLFVIHNGSIVGYIDTDDLQTIIATESGYDVLDLFTRDFLNG